MSNFNYFVRKNEENLFREEEYRKVLGKTLVECVKESVRKEGGTTKDVLRILSIYTVMNFNIILETYGQSLGKYIIGGFTRLLLKLLKAKEKEDFEAFVSCYENIKDVYDFFKPPYMIVIFPEKESYLIGGGLIYRILSQVEISTVKKILVESFFENIRITDEGVSKEDLKKITYGLEILNSNTNLVWLIEKIYEYSKRKLGTSYAQEILSLTLREIFTGKWSKPIEIHMMLNYICRKLRYLKDSDQEKYIKFKKLMEEISSY